MVQQQRFSLPALAITCISSLGCAQGADPRDPVGAGSTFGPGTVSASAGASGTSSIPPSTSGGEDGSTAEDTEFAHSGTSGSSGGESGSETTAASGADECSGPPRVIYLDDGGVPNDDPNGIQDLAIVLGWASMVDLRAIGSTSWNEGSAEFLQSIVTEAGSSVPVLAGDTLIDTIIAEARAMESCGETKLHVSIGGEWFKLAVALARAPDIAPYLHVLGIAGWNIRVAQTPEGVPRDAYDAIVAAVGEANIFRIDDKDDAAPRFPDFRDLYEVEPGYSVAGLDAFYDESLGPLLSRIPDPSEPARNVTQEASYYVSHTRALNHGQGEGDGSSASKLRIADCLTVAQVVWGNDATVDIFDKDDIFPLISNGLASLP